MGVCPGLSRVVRKGLRRTYEESRDVVTPAPRCGATNVVLIKIHVYIEDLVQDLFISVAPRWVAIAETLSGARVPVNETFVLPLCRDDVPVAHGTDYPCKRDFMVDRVPVEAPDEKRRKEKGVRRLASLLVVVGAMLALRETTNYVTDNGENEASTTVMVE